MTASLKRRFRQIKKWPSWLLWPLVPLLWAYSLLTRREFKDPHGCCHLDRFPWITVFWHDRMLFFPLMFSRSIRRRTAAMVSSSRDGQYLADLYGFLGLRSVRGSTSKKGAAALRGAFEELRRGNTVSLTPDGPRGPRYHMSVGPVILASRTGCSVLPATVNCSRCWQLRSWDRFQIPKPGAKVTLVLGEPIAIPPDLTDAETEHWRQILEQRLNAISQVDETERAEPFAGSRPQDSRQRNK